MAQFRMRPFERIQLPVNPPPRRRMVWDAEMLDEELDVLLFDGGHRSSGGSVRFCFKERSGETGVIGTFRMG